MPTLIIYDPITGDIVQARKKPTGSAPRPTIENCYPYDPEAKNKYKSFWVDKEMNTIEAKKYYVSDGKICRRGD